jgi:hypothetical protein
MAAAHHREARNPSNASARNGRPEQILKREFNNILTTYLRA